jgi:hypothetical protein
MAVRALKNVPQNCSHGSKNIKLNKMGATMTTRIMIMKIYYYF